jgi:molybdopterin synthase catalytic subunit
LRRNYEIYYIFGWKFWQNCTLLGKKVVRLEYEAYTSMAMKQLQKLCLDVRSKWPVCKMAIVHRTG